MTHLIRGKKYRVQGSGFKVQGSRVQVGDILNEN